MPAAKPSFCRLKVSHPLAQGVAALFPMDEGGGLALHDHSTYGRNGTLSGTTKPIWTSGQSGYCLSFNGTTAYVDCGVINLSSGFSYSFWLFPTNVNNTVIPFGSFNAAGSICQYALQFQTGGAIAHLTGVTSMTEWISSGGVIATGAWIHILVTNNGGVASTSTRIYVNSNQISTTYSAGGAYPTSSLGNTAIGRAGSLNGNYYNGLIDNVKLWSRPLSGIEADLDYADGFRIYRKRQALAVVNPFVWFPLAGKPVPGEEGRRFLPEVRKFGKWYFISGQTLDCNSGAPLSGVVVKLFRTSDNAYLGSVTSDASGNYFFNVPDGNTRYFLVGYLAGSPDESGTTVDTLTGV